MLIKVCGITREQEIKALNILKPDYIGFVFAESKRKVTKEEVRHLCEALNKEIKVVGVFRNNSIEYIEEVLEYLPLNVIQLHGDEDNNFIERLVEKHSCEVWKAVTIKSKMDMCLAINYHVDTLILDGSNPGSGEVFPWEFISGIKSDKRIFLAGGINEGNVLEGIGLVNPDGIDVSSGVEVIDDEGNRVKDKSKIERLIRKVRKKNEG
ncbi:phosphoribosylanthranilate isomerase [Clostridium paraputrificum]|uniref:phosphoribosylanthranilate isomerase n=1 Tax=Clostridium paraputrificum TaxID=29363 RepID=UPI003D3547A4